MRATTPPRSQVQPASKASQVPGPLTIAQALHQHDGLARLGLLIRESNRRLELIKPALPGALARYVRAGPVDETGWTLLASNAAVAAKLRHLQPLLEALLAEQGLQPALVRVKLLQQGS